uniref:Putative secreted protein n=1 Tax=Anopheles darlingi TaxID=43151 RepID=A0A2M4D409_ANODA
MLSIRKFVFFLSSHHALTTFFPAYRQHVASPEVLHLDDGIVGLRLVRLVSDLKSLTASENHFFTGLLLASMSMFVRPHRTRYP